MTTHSHDIVSDALVRAIAPGATATRVERLTGGVSAHTFALEVTGRSGTAERWVVRHRAPGFAKGALSAAQEHAVLSALHAAGLPVPRPLLFWAGETIVMDWIEGTSALPAQGPEAMADALAGIHAHGGEALDALPAREDPRPVLEQALAGLAGLPSRLDALAEPDRCLLHGDFWPGNLLWRGGALVAVLDWEDAAVGDPLSDVACARAELAVAAGAEAAEAFTARYFDVTGRDRAGLGLWDVYVSTAALGSMDAWGLPPEVLAHREAATRAFRDRAREALGAPAAGD